VGGLRHLIRRAGERQAHPAAAVQRIEVAAGRDCDAGFGEQPATELFAVPRQFRNIGVDVKSAFGRREAGEAGSRQRLDQDVAIGPVASDMAVELRATGKCRDRRELRQGCGEM
jgi:hypothetical protein